MSEQHDDIRGLLGAYALGAVSPLERRRVERHLETCRDCAREARMLTGVAAELGTIAEPDQDPGDLVDRIVEGFPVVRPRRSAWTRLAAAAAAAVALIAVAAGVVTVRQRADHGRLVDVVAAAERQVRLRPNAGFEGTGVLYIADGEVALVLEDVPPPGRSRSYQLWAIEKSGPRSMAVVDGSGRVVSVFRWEGDADSYAITVEPEGGSSQPTTTPVLGGA